METARTRPGGVVAVAVLMALTGVLTVASSTPPMATDVPPWALALDVVIGVLMLVVAWGLVTLRVWAWIVTLGVQAVNGVFAVVTVIGTPGAWPAWIAVGIAAIVIGYLTRPVVRAAFGMAPSTVV